MFIVNCTKTDGLVDACNYVDIETVGESNLLLFYYVMTSSYANVTIRLLLWFNCGYWRENT